MDELTKKSDLLMKFEQFVSTSSVADVAWREQIFETKVVTFGSGRI